MSNEHAPTGGEGVTTDGGTAVRSERTLTDDDLDALFEVLADDQRRRILGYLDDRDGDAAAFSDLIDHVVGNSDEGEADDCERAAVRLYHAHLPKMTDAGLVEYDARSETVRYRGGPAVSDWVAFARSSDPDSS